MKESEIEKEIFICDMILHQLNECLGVFKKSESSNFRVKEILKDIQIIKAEKNRLMILKEDVKGAAAKNDGVLSKRSRKNVSQRS